MPSRLSTSRWTSTIIRGVLLPATMALLGDWNWYLPKWLDRLMPGGPDPGLEEAPSGEVVFPAEAR